MKVKCDRLHSLPPSLSLPDPLPISPSLHPSLPLFQIFIKDNQGGGDKTVLNYLELFGSLLDTTNMAEFKRVSYLCCGPVFINPLPLLAAGW